jgi:hypothetical protein
MAQQQQSPQNAISNSAPPIQPLNLNMPTSTTQQDPPPHAETTSSPHMRRGDPPVPNAHNIHHPQARYHHPMSLPLHQPQQMDMDVDDDDEDIEVNVQDDDSPLDMRIATKQQDSDDSMRPSVIRRAPSFKETSNSPFDSSQSGTSGENNNLTLGI